LTIRLAGVSAIGAINILPLSDDYDTRGVESRQLVVMVSAEMGKRYWPGQTNVVGKRITFNNGVPTEDQHVVGPPS